MGYGIGLHGGADVVALAVDDDEHPPALGVLDGLIEGAHPLIAQHFVVGALRLHRGDDVAHRIDDAFVEGEEGFSGPSEGVAMLLESRFLDVFGDVIQLGVQAHYGGVSGFHNARNQTIK